MLAKQAFEAENFRNIPEEAEWVFYRKMFLIRSVEESLLKLYAKGLLFGTVHTCIGQEVGAVAIAHALDPQRDVVWSNHRGHGHYLAFTGDVYGLIAEVMGKAGGVCGGIGGSQHLHRGGFYSNGILGGTLPCAVGSAFAEKFKKTGGIAVVFFGDGALGEGIVYESFNIASLWKLPVLFVLEDNGYAQSTPKRYEHAGDIATRAESFCIPSSRMRAADVVEVSRTAERLVSEIRRGAGPQFLALETSRLASHSKGDDNREPEEIAALWAADPLTRRRAELLAQDADRLQRIEAEVAAEIERCVQAAIEDRAPTPEQFLKLADCQ